MTPPRATKAGAGRGAAGTRYLAALAGADNDLLTDVAHPAVERRRFATIGAAMHVPALSAGVGFGYGVAQKTGLVPAVVVGIIMAAVVLTIEAVLVRTITRDSGPGIVIARLIMAITIGLVASQGPLLFIFEDRIATELAAQHQARVQEVRDELAAERTAARATLEADRAAVRENALARTETIEGPAAPVRVEFDDDLEGLLEDRTCLTRLLTNEQSGIAETLPCGQSSGIPECGARCESIRDQLAVINDEIDTVRQARTDAIPDPVAVDPDDARIRTQAAATLDAELAAAETRYTETLDDIDAREADLDATAPDADLFARIEAVHHSAAATTTGLVILIVFTIFFFVLDTIGLLAKSAMPAGEHGLRLHNSEEEAAITSAARLAAIDNESLRSAAREEAAVRSDRDWMIAHLDRRRIHIRGVTQAVIDQLRLVEEGRAAAEAEGLDLTAYEAGVLDLRTDLGPVVPPPPGFAPR